MIRNVIYGILLALMSVCLALAQTDAVPQDSAGTAPAAISPPQPVTGLTAKDTPDDHGHSITLKWTLSPDDQGGAHSVRTYEVFRWVPFFMDSMHARQYSVDSLMGLQTLWRRYLPFAKDSIKYFEKSGNAETARRFADTVAYIEKRTSTLRGEIKSLQRGIENDWERAPQAHAQYPNGGEWQMVGQTFAGQGNYVNSGQKDNTASDYLPNGCNFYYRVDAVTADPKIRTSSEIVGPVQATGQWYNVGRTPSLFATGIFVLLVLLFVRAARKGKELYVRPLAGIEAVDEAIGRATEMGKPILYVLGLGTAADIATIASFTVLARVAKRVAEYQTELIVPTYDPIVMSVAQETIKSAYADAGRPDSYREEIVFFVTQNQFAYVSAVNGIMLRQHPATNVYMGKFFAESLILAETGALAGSIQISGTDEIAQIPFFVVACDYTLIGEELYAASAYLGREPVLLGSLKAQDYAKAAVIILAILGAIAVNFGWTEFREIFRVVR
ncbi:hypothetical protein C3F09_10485 [candidate division GN15 bacterium]|uniref:DUF6754 domain-containing protein n=1 Tax=candidate division GN15 bacterium TaxID=2072418 RepID=A0A855X3F6_9BACT|nr:MAG: hypothetical protein C3F09_10485 [candidate division GN15 bacterium]